MLCGSRSGLGVESVISTREFSSARALAVHAQTLARGATGMGASIPGNCDGDNDVDLDDYADFEACLAGPDAGLGTGCECFDFDGDEDNDLKDFARFQVNFTGN